MRIDDWFLAAGQRGNQHTAIDRRHDGVPWTEGNLAELLIDGDEYFTRLYATLCATTDGDAVYITGLEGDADERLAGPGTGAAEVHLHPGDVEWWDYRSWRGGGMSVPVVVGAFPEPFLHGFQWAKPGATIKGGGALATLLGHVVGPGPNEIDIEPSVPPDAARAERDGNKVRLVLGVRIAERLSSDPTALAYRYQVGK